MGGAGTGTGALKSRVAAHAWRGIACDGAAFGFVDSSSGAAVEASLIVASLGCFGFGLGGWLGAVAIVCTDTRAGWGFSASGGGLLSALAGGCFLGGVIDVSAVEDYVVNLALATDCAKSDFGTAHVAGPDTSGAGASVFTAVPEAAGKL